MISQWIFRCFFAAIVAHCLGGCDGRSPSASASASSKSGAHGSASSSSFDGQNQTDPKLAPAEKTIGFSFPIGSRLLGDTDDGTSGGEFHEWLIASPTKITMAPTFGKEFTSTGDALDSFVELVQQRLDRTYRIPAEKRLSGSPSASFWATMDASQYQVRVQQLELDTGECYIRISRHKN